MKVYTQEIPEDSELVVRRKDGKLQIIIRTMRPVPTWLPRKRGVRAEDGGWCKVGDDKIREFFLRAICKEPGYGKTHYTQLTREQGGCGGSLERKDAVLKEMIKEGLLKVVELEKPRGRQKNVLFVNELPSEETQAIMSA